MQSIHVKIMAQSLIVVSSTKGQSYLPATDSSKYSDQAYLPLTYQINWFSYKSINKLTTSPVLTFLKRDFLECLQYCRVFMVNLSIFTKEIIHLVSQTISTINALFSFFLCKHPNRYDTLLSILNFNFKVRSGVKRDGSKRVYYSLLVCNFFNALPFLLIRQLFLKEATFSQKFNLIAAKFKFQLYYRPNMKIMHIYHQRTKLVVFSTCQQIRQLLNDLKKANYFICLKSTIISFKVVYYRIIKIVCRLYAISIFSKVNKKNLVLDFSYQNSKMPYQQITVKSINNSHQNNNFIIYCQYGQKVNLFICASFYLQYQKIYDGS